MKKLSIAAGAILMAGCAPSEVRAESLLGLACTGQISFTGQGEGTRSEQHYVVDRARNKLIHRDAFSGEEISVYDLTVLSRQYRGERQESSKTNGGLDVYHYETVHISREDGSITSQSLSTTTLPSGPSTTAMKFEGQCVPENPDLRRGPLF